MRDAIKTGLDRFAARTGYAFVEELLHGPDGDPDAAFVAIKGYRQIESYTCGAVAGLMVLHAFHPRRSVDAFFRRCRADREWGTSTAKLARALRASGVGISIRKEAGFGELADEIEAGFPIITTLKWPTADPTHWVVLYGVGRRPRRIYVAGATRFGTGMVRARPSYSWNEFRRARDPGADYLVCWGK